MKDLPQMISRQKEAEMGLMCTKGHELPEGEVFCIHCFNEPISRVPLHLIGVGLGSGLLAAAAGTLLSDIVGMENAALVIAMGVGLALLGLGCATVYKLTVTKMPPLKLETEKSAYSRSLRCQNCGSSLRNGECPLCTRRKRIRSDAIGLAWFPAVFFGSFAFIFTVNVFGIIEGMIVIIGSFLPYLTYARWLDRQLPKFKDLPFRL